MQFWLWATPSLFLIGCINVSSPENGTKGTKGTTSTETTGTKGPSQTEQEREPNSIPLMTYLASPHIDPDVEAVAKIGVSEYSDPLTNLMTARNTARAMADIKLQSGGGRTGDWIRTTFRREETPIVNNFKKLVAPQVYTVSQIDDEFERVIKNSPPNAALKKAKYVLVKGVNVTFLHDSPLGKNAFVQLASQFNYLEATGAFIATVLSYLGDKTQGPMGSIEAAAAAMHRRASIEAGSLKDALLGVIPAVHESFYKDGYLEIFKLSDAELMSLKAYIEANIKNLGILAQWVINESSGVMDIQVFASAAAYQNSPTGGPAPNSLGAQICTILVAAQYEALAKLAVIRSIAINGPVAVHFTLVGASAFKNPAEVRAEGLNRAAHVVKGYPRVKIFVHGFSPNDQDEIRNSVDKNLVDLTEMDAVTFMTAAL